MRYDQKLGFGAVRTRAPMKLMRIKVNFDHGWYSLGSKYRRARRFLIFLIGAISWHARSQCSAWYMFQSSGLFEIRLLIEDTASVT